MILSIFHMAVLGTEWFYFLNWVVDFPVQSVVLWGHEAGVQIIYSLKVLWGRPPLLKSDSHCAHLLGL